MNSIIEVERAVLDDRLLVGGLRLHVEHGRIASLEPGATSAAIDATLLPAPIDLQVNGAGGHSVDEATLEALDAISRSVLEGGAAAFLPTLISAPFERLLKQARAVADWIEAGRAPGARPLGLHIEGPFLELPGAHEPEALLPPTPELIQALLEACGGHLKLVTLAPSLPGAARAVENLVACGVQVSIGHAANSAQLDACLDAGARSATHLFNAMGRMHHRQPGLADLLMDDERVLCALIPDGVHVHPVMLRAAWRRLGPGRCMIVTDCMAAAGMPPGRYELAGRTVERKGREVRDESGALAGSAILMREAIEGFRAAIPACDAVAIAQVSSRNPARLLLDEERGRIAPGALAELMLLHADGRLELLR